MTPEQFAEKADVSRETLKQLIEYKELLEKWQKRINLVSAATLPEFWLRHADDSAQLAPLLPKAARTLVDLGSGAGFPGLVLALMEKRLHTHLVESDQRKAAFLGEVCRATGLARAVTIHAQRIERLRELKADVVTARALAPLSELLGYAEKILAPDGVCLFLKGARVDGELADARKSWRMNVDRIKSRTDDSGVILRITDLAHA
jgi:16S rRNA (guanine527-N7)-methyltransferase